MVAVQVFVGFGGCDTTGLNKQPEVAYVMNLLRDAATCYFFVQATYVFGKTCCTGYDPD